MTGRRVAAQPSYSHKPYVQHESDIWTRANAGEVLPGVITPLTWSVSEDDWDKLFTITLQRMGIDQQGNSAQLFYGRIYFNFGLMAAGLKQLGLPTGDFLSNVGGPELEGDSLSEGFRPLSIVRHLPGIMRERLAERGLLKRFERQVAETDAEAARIRQIDLSTLSEPEIADFVEQLTGLIQERLELLMEAQSAAFGLFGQVRWYLKRWVGDDSQANDLLTGISGLKTAEANIELWRIARRARREPAVRTTVEQSASDELLERLQSKAATKSTAEELHAYLDEFGHRAADELEARTPRWVEQPGPLMAAFRGYVLAAEELDPEGFEERQKQRRMAAEEEVRRTLSKGLVGKLLPWRWWLFRASLREAQSFMPMRENPKFHLLKLSLYSRRALVELARRWQETGLLGDDDDIFFLRGEEVLRFARLPQDGRTDLAEQLKQLIVERRSEFARYEVMDPPMVLMPGDLERTEPLRETSDGYVDGNLLKGIPASAGVATGRARVILRPGDATLEAGEILVAPFTDPGWTPFFPLAAAVVMDLGGMLSHGAVVAREYGIPAVVNTRVATSQIKTGQMVFVDGRAGTVTLIAE